MISNNVSQLKKGDKSQVDNSRLNVSGKEALYIYIYIYIYILLPGRFVSGLP